MKKDMQNIRRLLELLKSKDKATYMHSLRCAKIAQIFIHKFPNLFPSCKRKELLLGILLHDIGKIMTPKHLLVSAKIFTEKQMKVMKEHPQNGFLLLKSLLENKKIPLFALQHHECPNGAGYPSNLNMKEITAGMALCSITDAFDAMTAGRAYRRTLTIQEALKELQNHAGTKFDAEILAAFSECASELQSIVGKTNFKLRDILK